MPRKPTLTYAGGKARTSSFISKVIDIIDQDINGDDLLPYLEPFVGAAGIMRKMAENDLENSPSRGLKGVDLNADVIAMWKSLQKGWKPPTTCSKKTWDSLKSTKKVSAKKGFLGIVCSYGGIFYGTFRPKITHHSNARGTYTDNMASLGGKGVKAISSDCKNVKFSTGSYDDLDPYDTVIYCDPPYVGNAYTGHEFLSDFDHVEFWETMREWSRKDRGNTVLISEYKAPKDFAVVWKRDVAAVVNREHTSRRTEKVFMHKPAYKRVSRNAKIEAKNVGVKK
jgi:site-specific DNA-adenine methylase